MIAFSYNARNRPASVARNSVPYAAYACNAFEQRVSREAPVQKTQANGVQLNMCTITGIRIL